VTRYLPRVRPGSPVRSRSWHPGPAAAAARSHRSRHPRWRVNENNDSARRCWAKHTNPCTDLRVLSVCSYDGQEHSTTSQVTYVGMTIHPGGESCGYVRSAQVEGQGEQRPTTNSSSPLNGRNIMLGFPAEGACSHHSLATTNRVTYVGMSIHPEGRPCSVLRSSRCSQHPPCLVHRGSLRMEGTFARVGPTKKSSPPIATARTFLFGVCLADRVRRSVARVR